MTTSRRQARHRYTYQEYLAYERDSGMKHEYGFLVGNGQEIGERLRHGNGLRRFAQTGNGSRRAPYLHRLA